MLSDSDKLTDMKPKYAEYTNSQVVQAMLERFGLTQTVLAKMFYVSQSRISEALTGKGGLRPAVRQAMIDLLDADDHSFVIDGKQENENAEG